MGKMLVLRFAAQDSKGNTVTIKVGQEVISSRLDSQGKVEHSLTAPTNTTNEVLHVNYLGGNVYQLVETGEKLLAYCFQCGTLAADRWFRLNCHRLYCPECAAELDRAGASFLSLAPPAADADEAN